MCWLLARACNKAEVRFRDIEGCLACTRHKQLVQSAAQLKMRPYFGTSQSDPTSLLSEEAIRT